MRENKQTTHLNKMHDQLQLTIVESGKWWTNDSYEQVLLNQSTEKTHFFQKNHTDPKLFYLYATTAGWTLHVRYERLKKKSVSVCEDTNTSIGRAFFYILFRLDRSLLAVTKHFALPRMASACGLTLMKWVIGLLPCRTICTHGPGQDMIRGPLSDALQ